MKRRKVMSWFPPVAGFELGTLWSKVKTANHLATQMLLSLNMDSDLQGVVVGAGVVGAAVVPPVPAADVLAVVTVVGVVVGAVVISISVPFST